MIDPRQFREHVVRPTLTVNGLWSQAAENLLVGTAIQESRLTYLVQHGGGPALGVYQIEPATHEDVWVNYLRYRPHQWLAREPDSALVTDLEYATAIARIIYYRRPEPLPDADDIEGLGAYWKQHYNTPLGKGRVAEWVLNYREYA